MSAPILLLLAALAAAAYWLATRARPEPPQSPEDEVERDSW